MRNPSCVPRLALLIGYLVVTITGMATFVFLVVSAYRHRARRASVALSPKAVTKLRLILLSSVYVGGSMLVFFIASIRLGVSSSSALWWGDGIIRFYCLLVSPALVAATLSVSELWLGVLPSLQLLPANCLAARLVELDKEIRAFFWMASIGYAGMVVLGFMSFFVDPFLVLKIADLVCVSGATVNGLCIIFVGANTQQVIRTAMAKASEVSKSFYAEAEKILVLQVFALIFATAIFVTTHSMKYFSTVGSSTPLIPTVTTHVISYGGLCLAILFVKLPPEQNATSGSGFASASAGHLVRSAIFRATGGRWGSRGPQHVIVVRVQPTGYSSNNNYNTTRRKYEPGRSQYNSGVSLSGAGSSVVPTESQ